MRHTFGVMGDTVTELDGVFSLRTPKDLLDKLESEFKRLTNADATSLEAQYAAFDFFVTAEHLPEWMSHGVGGSLSSHRAYPEGALVSHVASGAKHFHVLDPRHKSVSDTRSAGIFDPKIFDPQIFDVGRLVIELEDGSTDTVADVALRVLTHWRGVICPHTEQARLDGQP